MCIRDRLYLASALEKIGIETDILDASVGGKDYSLKDTFYRRIRQGNGLIRIGMNFNEIADYVEKGNFDFHANTKLYFDLNLENEYMVWTRLDDLDSNTSKQHHSFYIVEKYENNIFHAHNKILTPIEEALELKEDMHVTFLQLNLVKQTLEYSFNDSKETRIFGNCVK